MRNHRQPACSRPTTRQNSDPAVRGAGAGLFTQLLIREIRNRFIGSATGWLWLLVNPLLMLAVYAYVFGVIFQSRVPAGLEMPFIAWLAVALWPWWAFADGVLRGSQAIVEHAALISKVALPRELLVIAATSSVFLLHMVGYAVVLIAIQATAADIHWISLPAVLFTLSSLYILAIGLALGLAAVQVFVRDLEQVLPTLFLFWFFLTPILYGPELLTESMARWLNYNPMTWWVGEIREGLLLGRWLPGIVQVLLLAASVAVAAGGRALFTRLNPHFEDFL